MVKPVKVGMGRAGAGGRAWSGGGGPLACSAPLLGLQPSHHAPSLPPATFACRLWFALERCGGVETMVDWK